MAKKKFVIKSARYINGVLHPASPSHPATVELEESEAYKADKEGKLVLDRGLFAVDSPEASEKPKPHFLPKEVKQAQSAAAHHSTPLDSKGKRPSDKDVA
jgi:hypothetical protein